MKKTATYYLIEALSRVQSADWQKALKLVKLVRVLPLEDPSLRKVAKTLTEVKTKAKSQECYLNSLACCLTNSEVDYCEGYVEVNGVPIEHAWNAYRGVHFDLTHEKMDLEYPHLVVMRCPSSEALALAMVKGVTGPYLLDWIKNQ